MRRLVVTLVLAFGLATAYAQEADEQPRAYDSLTQKEKEHEIQMQNWSGPSGFWTSPHKSKFGAYRYRMMGIGAVLILGMGLFTRRLIKRANSDRDKRDNKRDDDKQ
jgi:hypothetical protein